MKVWVGFMEKIDLNNVLGPFLFSSVALDTTDSFTFATRPRAGYRLCVALYSKVAMTSRQRPDFQFSIQKFMKRAEEPRLFDPHHMGSTGMFGGMRE